MYESIGTVSYTHLDVYKRQDETYGVMIAGCFDILAGKVIRLGHMGENANVEDVTLMLDALDRTFADLGYPLKASMKDVFLREMK